MTALPGDSRPVISGEKALGMAENEGKGSFTIYLDGHAGHQGNVLAHAFLAKARGLILVLNKLERAYIDSGVRQTDFEIVDADKFNPTTLSLKPVPRTKAYDPFPTLDWSLQQIEAVGNGIEPDQKVNSEIAYDLARLALKESETAYRSFWINGHAAPVRFDEDYLENARKIARKRAREEAPSRWRVGVAQGSVVGELKKVDDLEGENEFVIVPPVGARRIVCTFSPELREKMGRHLFRVVRVTGQLHYGEESPFPYRVDAANIEEMPKRRRAMRELRGVFSGQDRVAADWGPVLDGI